MTGKAVSQFAYGLLNDEPHKGNLRDLARRRLIKKASPKPVSHGPDCSGSKSMNLVRIISVMFLSRMVFSCSAMMFNNSMPQHLLRNQARSSGSLVLVHFALACLFMCSFAF